MEENNVVVTLPHSPLARPEELVMEYLKTHDTITNTIGRKITGIRDTNKMKDVFQKLRDEKQIELVPGLKAAKSAWQLKKP